MLYLKKPMVKSVINLLFSYQVYRVYNVAFPAYDIVNSVTKHQIDSANS
jgi:hypothetical protein